MIRGRVPCFTACSGAIARAWNDRSIFEAPSARIVVFFRVGTGYKKKNARQMLWVHYGTDIDNTCGKCAGSPRPLWCSTRIRYLSF
jgi:hypothetical protein